MAKITTYSTWDLTKEDEPLFIKFEKNEDTGKITILERIHAPAPKLAARGVTNLLLKHGTREDQSHAMYH